MNTPRRTTLAAAALALLLAAGCSSTKHTATTAPPTTHTPSPTQAPTTAAIPIPSFPTETPTPSPTPTAKRIGGAAATYTDGLAVQVPSAVRFTPSNTAAGLQHGQTGVLVTVSITNGTSASVDLTVTRVQMTAGTAGNQAQSVFDTANGVGSGFSGSVLPGHSQTAKYAFSVAPSDLGDVVVEVTPDFQHNPVSFEGAVR